MTAGLRSGIIGSKVGLSRRYQAYAVVMGGYSCLHRRAAVIAWWGFGRLEGGRGPSRLVAAVRSAALVLA
jgi:hypothetical protein